MSSLSFHFITLHGDILNYILKVIAMVSVILRFTGGMIPVVLWSLCTEIRPPELTCSVVEVTVNLEDT